MTRLLVSILLLAGLAGCVTPVIPLPPPRPESYTVALSTDKDGITISGTEQPDALVFAFNIDKRTGVIGQANENGIFTTPALPASDGNKLSFWSSRGTEEASSEMACAVLSLPAGAETGKLTGEPCRTGTGTP